MVAIFGERFTDKCHISRKPTVSHTDGAEKRDADGGEQLTVVGDEERVGRRRPAGDGGQLEGVKPVADADDD